jgi:hypothetical protein
VRSKAQGANDVESIGVALKSFEVAVKYAVAVVADPLEAVLERLIGLLPYPVMTRASESPERYLTRSRR